VRCKIKGIQRINNAWSSQHHIGSLSHSTLVATDIEFTVAQMKYSMLKMAVVCVLQPCKCQTLLDMLIRAELVVTQSTKCNGQCITKLGTFLKR